MAFQECDVVGVHYKNCRVSEVVSRTDDVSVQTTCKTNISKNTKLPSIFVCEFWDFSD